MSSIYLIVLLILEIGFRLAVEIREWRLMQKKRPLAFFRCVPLLNDLVPFPNFSNGSESATPVEKEFIFAHEGGHRKNHHWLLRNILKIVFFFGIILVVYVQLTEWQIHIVEVLLWFHFELLCFRLIYHKICWSEEIEADAWARQKVGKNKTRMALEYLNQKEMPMSLLFAFLYWEHPPAFYRIKKSRDFMSRDF